MSVDLDGTPDPCDCWCECGTLMQEPPNPQDGLRQCEACALGNHANHPPTEMPL